MNTVESGLKDITGATGGAESGIQDVSDSMDSLHDSGSGAGLGIDTVDSALDGMMDSSSSASGALDDTGTSLDDLGSSGDNAGAGIDVVDAALDSVDGSSDSASASVSKVGAALEDTGISAESAGAGIDGASDSLEGVSGSSEQAKDGLDDVGDSADEADLSMGKLIKTIAGIAAAVGVFTILRNAVDLAFQRIDTMEQFERVMTEMTGSTAEANEILDQTNDIVTGTAYGLDVAAKSVQDFVTRGVEVGEATRYIEAWGDAVAFYGDGSNEQFANVTNALQNMLTKGKVGMDQLNRLFEAGIPAVDIFAQATGMSVEVVSESLSNGEISAETFVSTVTTAMMEGTNGVTKIAGAAKEAGASWGGAFANMGAATARGVTAIIQAIDNMLANNGLPTMRDMVGQFGSFMESTMKTAATVIEPVGNALFWLLEPLGSLLGVAKPLVPVIGAMVAAFTGMMILKSIGTVLMGFRASLLAIEVVQKSVAVVTAATSFAMTIFSGASVASAAGASGLSVAMVALRVALGALMGPVGWIITGLAGVAAGAVALWNHFNKTSEETERLKGETEELSESTDNLVDTMRDSAGVYSDRVRDIDATREANSELVQTVEKLSDKENKSAEDKRDLSLAVDQLNGEVRGLNATYNEEADRLSASAEQMQARIDLMYEQDKANAAQERLTEILKEQQEVELQLGEVNALREEWVRNLNNGEVSTREYKKAVAELDEQQQTLKDTYEQLGIQYDATYDVFIATQDQVTKIVQDGNAAMLFSYEELEDYQKGAFDRMADRYNELKDAATNAFDEIETESEISLSEMVSNMKKNQKAVEEWGENQAALLKWAGENGYESFIPYIERMGIDQAGTLNEMVQGVDDSNVDHAAALVELAETVENGYGVAMEGAKASVGDGLSEVADIIIQMVEAGEMSTVEAIEAANFYELFGVLPDEAASAIDDGGEEVEQSATRLVGRIGIAADIALGNYDFEAMGAKPPADLSMGMSTGSTAVEMASRGVGADAVEPMMTEIDNADIEGAGDSITETLTGRINNGKESVAWASGEVGKTPGTEISKEIGSTPFETIGGSAPTRTGEGIIANKGIATAAASGLIDDVKSEFENGFNQSIYIDYGSNTGYGTGGGIDGSAGIATGAAKNLADNVDSEVSSGMTQSKYEGYGNNVGVGLGNGILAMSDFVAGAVRSVSSDASAAATGALGIHSPSIVFFGYGKFVSQGLGNGILDGKSGVINSILAMTSEMINRTSIGMDNMQRTTQTGISGMDRRMGRLKAIASSNMRGMQNNLNFGASVSVAIMTRLSSNIIRPFGGIQGRMAAIGGYAMSGLQSGLNSRVGRVISTANSIANRVTSTIQRALRIHSPSKVMEQDVGRWIPEGIAVGIERYAGKVYSVIDAMADYVSSPFDVATPQFDIAGQVANTNAQIQSRVSHELSHQGDFRQPQPAYINFTLGDKAFSGFSDDITEDQQIKNIRLRPRRLS